MSLPVPNKEQPKLLAILEYQHELDCRIESKIKDLYEINNRLDNLANRLNSSAYPKNIPQESAKEPGSPNGLSAGPTQSDGLVGELININERGNRRLDEVQSAITSIFIAINYLEAHI
jgi:hypothetical protein